MKLHEYQTKELLRRYGVPVPDGGLAFTPSAAVAVADGLSSAVTVLKAQVHAGGRGKAGGIKIARDHQEVEQLAAQLLSLTLVTPQTGAAGKKVRKILVEEGLDIRRELYLSLIVDRGAGCFTILASAAGGMDIEETAARDPGAIVKVAVDPLVGLRPHHARQVAFGLGLAPELHKALGQFLGGLYRLFSEYDCLLLEVNPLVVTGDGRLLALDAKADFDDNALFRHPDLAAMRDPDEEEPLELEASRHDLNYISMPGGNVGNMVNGAGLAMATMDIIKQAGAQPANFLDVGGGASAERVEHGLRIILSDPSVKAVLINIFGGILRCDVLAAGVAEAARKTGLSVPVVVRMEGTNADQGRCILNDSGLDLIGAADLEDAAAKVAGLVRGGAPGPA
jgi:succinyl-CoA synthetase beta subunit